VVASPPLFVTSTKNGAAAPGVLAPLLDRARTATLAPGGTACDCGSAAPPFGGPVEPGGTSIDPAGSSVTGVVAGTNRRLTPAPARFSVAPEMSTHAVRRASQRAFTVLF